MHKDTVGNSRAKAYVSCHHLFAHAPGIGQIFAVVDVVPAIVVSGGKTDKNVTSVVFFDAVGVKLKIVLAVVIG